MKSPSSTFCTIPFVSLMINTDTTIRYCCMVKGSANKIKKENGTTYTIKDNFTKDAWNSTDMKDIRLAMLAGEKVLGCEVCYSQENNGRMSNREHANREWAHRLGEDRINQLISSAKHNNGVIENNIVYLDLRLGNLCNLKCRMCNPWNSSQIAKEHIELNKTDDAYSKVWKDTFGVFPVSVLDEQQWFDNDILWDQVISLIPDLQKVYMTGGEPTLITNNFKFMQSCIDQKRSDIILFFNTNCTNINKKFLTLISQFNSIWINASLDGIGKVNEYIRAPSNWDTLNKNVESLAKLPNIKLGITPTVQVYNIFNLIEILEWVDTLNITYNKNIFVDFLINFHPNHLNVNILPDDIRHEVATDLEKYKANKQLHEMTANSINGVIGMLKNPRAADYTEQISKLKTYTNSLDRERSQNIADINTRLSNLINEQL